MIEQLTMLADEIAALRKFGEQTGDGLIEALAEQFAVQFGHALDDATEHPMALEGEMPWWSSRTDK